jgi:hypothetical protein
MGNLDNVAVYLTFLQTGSLVILIIKITYRINFENHLTIVMTRSVLTRRGYPESHGVPHPFGVRNDCGTKNWPVGYLKITCDQKLYRLKTKRFSLA